MFRMSYEHKPRKTPMDGRLWHQLLDSKAEQYPDTEAVIMYDMDMNRSAMTFAEYRDRSTYLAASLLELGLSRGQHVLLVGQTSLRYIVFLMALHRIGSNAILLGPGDVTPDKLKLLKTLYCRMIAYDPEMKESQRKQLLAGIKQLSQHNISNSIEKQILISLRTDSGEYGDDQSIAYEGLIESDQSQDMEKLKKAQNEVQFDDPIVALFTSGSTGESKAVQLTTHSTLNFFNGASFGRRKAIFYNDRPVSWLGGYAANNIGLRYKNTSTVKAPTEMAVSEALCEGVFQIWQKEKCTMCLLNPVLVQKLLTDSMHLKYDFSHIGVFNMIGQRYSLGTMAALTNMFPKVAIALEYGSSESCLLAKLIVNKETALEEKDSRLTIKEGVEVKIVDEESKLVSRGTPGEICTRNASVFLEYLENPEATKQTKSSTGWVHMGDTGIMYDDGKIEVIGRKTEIIKRATVKIFPAHIEKVLLQHPQVSDVVVVGIPDQQLHEEVCACVILREDTESDGSDEEANVLEIREWCKKQWPPGPDGLSLTPKYILPMKKFPLLERTGKTFVRGVKDYALKKLNV